MFQAGHEFAAHRIGGLAGTAGVVSLAGVTTPVLLGSGLVVLTAAPAGDRDGVPLAVSAVFVGVARP